MLVWLEKLVALDPEGTVIVARWRVLDAFGGAAPPVERLRAATAAWLAEEYELAVAIAGGRA